MQFGWQRCRCRAAELYPGDIEPQRARLWRIQQVGDDGRHHVDPGAALLHHRFPVVGHAEAVRHHHRAAVHDGRHRGHYLAVDVIQRQCAHHAVLRRQLMGAARVFPASDHTSMREHHAFRFAGGARGVHQQRVVVLAHWMRLHRRQRYIVKNRDRIRIDDYDLDVALDVFECGMQARRQFGAGKHQPRVRMLQHIDKLRRLREQVERRHHVTRVHDADQQAAGLVAVVQHKGDLIAFAEPLAVEMAAELHAIRLELRVAHYASGFWRDQVRRGGLLARLQVNVMSDSTHEEDLEPQRTLRSPRKS